MSVEKLSLPAPAKLNLFLHITGKREDGYHNLQTLFVFLDHGDELDFETAPGDGVTVSPPIPGVPLEKNLIYRAVTSLAEFRRKQCGIRISLKKVLPMGGGIGGGSSDAATARVAANRLWDCGLSTDRLAEIGRCLGADVPVFVRGHAAFAQGVGEILQPVEVEEKWYLVVVPDAHVSTREIFCHPDLPRNAPVRNLAELRSRDFGNDCQDLVKKLYPQVANALEWLLKYAPSRMTGTGACVFGEFADRSGAEDAYRQLPDGWRAFVAKSLNRSPLYRALEDQKNHDR